MAKLPRLSRNNEGDPFAPDRGPLFTPRFVLALVLVLGGIGWILYYYYGIRPNDGWPVTKDNPAGGPSFFQDLEGKNYLIGFIALFVGLMVAAHPSTPLGRGRGVVTSMLACFVVGLLWICIFYIFLTGNDPKDIPVFTDLDQKNLMVGIAFMAVGFTFATRWE